MKIVFVNGSPRKDGYTARLMECIEEGIDKNHAVEWIHTYDLNMKPCQACLGCRPNQECLLPADAGHDAARLIRAADALVIGSPTYFGNISGPLKTLIDRSLTAFEEIAASGLEMPIPLHRGKKALMVTACNIPAPFSQQLSQSAGTLLAIKTVLDAGGYEIIGRIVLDGAASRRGIPPEIAEESRKLGAQLAP